MEVSSKAGQVYKDYAQHLKRASSGLLSGDLFFFLVRFVMAENS